MVNQRTKYPLVKNEPSMSLRVHILIQIKFRKMSTPSLHVRKSRVFHQSALTAWKPSAKWSCLLYNLLNKGLPNILISSYFYLISTSSQHLVYLVPKDLCVLNSTSELFRYSFKKTFRTDWWTVSTPNPQTLSICILNNHNYLSFPLQLCKYPFSTES